MLRKHDLPTYGTPRMFAQYALLSGNWYWAGGRSHWPLNAFTPLWSISVEEQFYIFWPLAVALLSRRGLWFAAAVLVAGAVATEALLGYWHSDTDAVVWTNSFVQFEMFAAGAACGEVAVGAVEGLCAARDAASRSGSIRITGRIGFLRIQSRVNV